jgi:IS5 family transposase
MIAAQIRRVRKLVPELRGVWVREHNLEPGRPPCDWDDPADIDRLVSELVDDANELVWAAEELDLVDSQAVAAVALLALLAGQDVEPGGRPGQWRIVKGITPDRVVSTVDPESRHTHKTSHSYRDGYKAHVAVEPDTGLVTDTDLTTGNTGDAEAAPGLVADEPAGTEVQGDSAYASGEFRDHLQRHDMTAVIKPPPLRAATTSGYTLDDFDIDTTVGTVTCPAGITVTLTPGRRAAFGGYCATCPVRRRCTTATGGRVIVLHAHHDPLAAARAQAATDDFDDAYRRHRPMVERSIAWLVRQNRRLRYRGVERNRAWWTLRCGAVNLKRLVNLGLSVDTTGTWTITAPAR